MNNYYIYVYLNPLKVGNFSYGKVNFVYEPFYIGKGKDNRLMSHLIDYNTNNKLKKNIINKIKKTGNYPIIEKLYENISEYSAFRLEKYFIKLIGRKDLNSGSLSNLTDGGEGCSGRVFNDDIRYKMIKNKQKIVQYDKNGKIIKIWKNIIDILNNNPNILSNHLHRSCRSNGHRKINGFFWKYHENESFNDSLPILDKYKTIFQYDKNGKFIKEWNESKEISQNEFHSGSVLKCCRNNSKSDKHYIFKNYIWVFKNDNKIIKPYEINKSLGYKRRNKNKINMYNLNNEYVKTINVDKLIDDGFNIKTIYRCCNKKLNSTQGYKWEWCK